MILDVPAWLRQFVPSAGAIGPMSVARIETTRPVYLVFDENGGAPRWIIRVGEADRLLRVHRILERLYPAVPGLVAESICCEPLAGGEWIHIQAGLAGRPWFSLQQACRTRADWGAIQGRAHDALLALHRAIEQQPAWRARIDPAGELRMQIDRAFEGGLLTHGHQAMLDRALRSLEPVGMIDAAYQHGDFAFNNLLFGAAGAAVIDFDECGDTLMPLHDEFSLALSCEEMAPIGMGNDLGCVMSACAGATLERSPWLDGALEGLFLHHLLWRLVQCADIASRRRMRSRFMGLLDRFARDPAAPFVDLRRNARSLSPC